MTPAGTGIKAAVPDSVLHGLLHQPRKLFLRRAMFQVHLWTGLLLALYVVVIALSGAMLVFKTELNAMLVPRALTRPVLEPTASVGEAVQAARSACARCSITMITVPSPAMPVYQLQGTD